MKTECDNYRNQVPKALLGDLTASDQKTLESHLSACPACARERDTYAETLRQLRTATDVEAPRHFFVHPPERRPTAWDLFQQLAFPLKAALLAAVLVLGVFTGVAAADLTVRREPGSLTLTFGKLPAPVKPGVPLDVAALKSELLQALENNQHEKDLELARSLRAEIGRIQARLPERQRLLIERALTDLEKRTDDRILTAATALEASTERSLARMYRIMQTEQQQALTALDERVNRIAVSGEIKNNQTDVILETLLQVADLKLK